MALLSTLRAVANNPQEEVAVTARRLKPFDLEGIRYPGEVEAAKRLRKLKGFSRTLRTVEMDMALHPAWRRKLDEALRLDPESAPSLFAALADVCDLLGFDGKIEAYQDIGDINATMTSTDRGAMLTLEGPVLEIMAPQELRGLLGHELAHYLCHSGPGARFRPETRVALDWRGKYEENEDDRAQILAASALLVAEEITSDRFEVLVCQDLDTYLRTSLKFSTELQDTVVRHDPKVLLRQAREALEGSVGRVDRRASHPERHLRVRAAELFFESDLFRQLTGIGAGLRPIADVNEEIAQLLVGWVPRGADRIYQERFERFLLAAARAIVSADGVFRPEERRYLARALPTAWRGRLPTDEEAEKMVDDFAEELRVLGDQRALLTTLNFLCGAVEADGRVEDTELRAIDMLGRALGAKELFRHELRERFRFDPKRSRHEARGMREDAVRDASPCLLRFLDTVIVARKRRTTLSRLLSLGGYRDTSELSRKKLAAVLDASGLVASAPLRRVKLRAPLSLATEEASARVARRTKARVRG